MAVKINNISYSGFFYNGEALTTIYLNGNKVYGSEPQEYSITLTPVEWVSNENISTRIWLDLGYVWKNNSRAQLGFVIPGTHQKPNGQQVFGEDTVWASDGNGPVDDNNDLRLFFTKSGSNIGAYWDVATSRAQATIGAITDVWQDWEIGNNYIKNLSNNTNFVTGSTYNISRTGNVGLYGACQYLNTGRTDCVRYSYVKIYEGDTLVKDIIPVLDNNNIPCFFDKISEELIYYKVNGEPSTGLTAGNAIQKLDYLQGDGSDYVVLDYIPSATTVAEIVVEGGDSTNRYLFGGRNRSSNGTLLSSVAINNYTSSKFYFLRGSKSYQVSNTTSKQTIKSAPDGGYINGTKVATYTEQTDTINAPFGLYHAMQYVNGNITIDTGLPQRGFNGKIYSFKVWENNTLVRNYVPVVINGKTGFYDTVLNNFYPSVYNTLTSGSVVGDVSIKIVYSESSVTISNSSTSGITVGNTFNLNASVVPTGSTLTYSSSNPSVASVDSNGIVSGVASGSTTITITASEVIDDENRIVYRSGTSTVNLSVEEASQPFNPLTDSKYFVIQARSATTLTIESVSSPTGTTAYRVNGIDEWTTANTNANTDISLNQGDYLEFKGNINHASNKYYRFKTSVAKSIDCGGYLAALEKNAEIDSSNNTVNNAFCCLFSGCTGLVNAQDLKLPDNTTTDMCRTFFRSCSNLVTAPQLPANGTIAVRAYQYMFANCNSLTTPPVLSASTVSENSYAYMFYQCKFVTPPELPATNLAKGCYGYMFDGCSNLESAPSLPATTLAESCYQYMFRSCTKLENAPIISATTLASKCYTYMFNKCSKLVTAPQLPVTTLANNCYEHMFDRCTSLVNPPSLPATTLTNYCYSNMFWGCSSLVNPPSLPATTLTNGCYQGMFNGCTKLTTAPDLPATTLVNNCYFYMFTGCTALKSLRVGFSTISGTTPLTNWLNNITTTGVLYAPSGATYSASDISLPSTWTLSKTLSS
jgi:Bacterial Ig-like domain (group 2).